jgi:hypothetical protein
MLIQYEDVEMRRRRLAELVGIEDKVWVQIGDSKRVFGIADEDMERSNDDKTSAVHFMRYQLDQSQIENAKSGAGKIYGVEHLAFPSDDVTVNEAIRTSLIADLDKIKRFTSGHWLDLLACAISFAAVTGPCCIKSSMASLTPSGS